MARLRECQFIITTHSPYVLEELPLSARAYILEDGKTKDLVTGVSPHFAMSKMDGEPHPECELYVEDRQSAIWLDEILSRHASDLFVRCATTPYGAANLGVALGQMMKDDRFRVPTVVFLDGDQDEAEGCVLLPGDDAPERVVFSRLMQANWRNIFARIARERG